MTDSWDDLDDASDAEIQRALGATAHVNWDRVHSPTRPPVKLRLGSPTGKRNRFEPEVRNLNETVTGELKLPGYMWAALGSDADKVIRELVRDYIACRDESLVPQTSMRVLAMGLNARRKFTRALAMKNL